MMIPIGHRNFVESTHVVSILRLDSSSARRLRRSAAESGLLVTATGGRTAKSLIILKTNHVVISALTVQTLRSRLGKLNPSEKKQKEIAFY